MKLLAVAVAVVAVVVVVVVVVVWCGAVECPKVVRTCVFSMLTWKCASHHIDIHFFDISTSQSAPGMVCLYMVCTF